MATVTADDVRALARAQGEHPVLALTDERVEVCDDRDDSVGTVFYSKAELDSEFGPDLTDAEATILAAALTARITEV